MENDKEKEFKNCKNDKNHENHRKYYTFGFSRIWKNGELFWPNSVFLLLVKNGNGKWKRKKSFWKTISFFGYFWREMNDEKPGGNIWNRLYGNHAFSRFVLWKAILFGVSPWFMVVSRRKTLFCKGPLEENMVLWSGAFTDPMFPQGKPWETIAQPASRRKITTPASGSPENLPELWKDYYINLRILGNSRPQLEQTFWRRSRQNFFAQAEKTIRMCQYLPAQARTWHGRQFQFPQAKAMLKASGHAVCFSSQTWNGCAQQIAGCA